jgi:hypothetical protein
MGCTTRRSSGKPRLPLHVVGQSLRVRTLEVLREGDTFSVNFLRLVISWDNFVRMYSKPSGSAWKDHDATDMESDDREAPEKVIGGWWKLFHQRKSNFLFLAPDHPRLNIPVLFAIALSTYQ